MEYRFANNELQRLDEDPSYTGRRSQEVVRGFRKLVQMIEAAPDERTFYQKKGLHYEALEGRMAGYRSMRINDQFRLIVSIEDNPKTMVIHEISDHYHA